MPAVALLERQPVLKRRSAVAAAVPRDAAAVQAPPAVEFEHVSFAFDDRMVLRDVSFSVPAGRMKILLGASGSGKSVLLRLAIGLLRPDSGRIRVNGVSIERMSERELMQVRAGVGMMFQDGALFDSLTVEDNIGYRLYEEMRLPLGDVRTRVGEVAGFVGLGEFLDRLPAELSGGQRRRVALARAIAHGPDLVLLDDPTSGLDPIIARTVDDEIIKLRDLEQVSLVMVTHQIRDAYYIATHRAVRDHGQLAIVPTVASVDAATFMVLQDGTMCFDGTAEDLLNAREPYLRQFLFMTLPPW